MSTSTDNLTALAEGLVAHGRKNGADQIEVSIEEGNEFTVSVLEGNVDRLVEAGSRAVSVRVFVDGKAANATSSDLSATTLRRLVENAVTRARLGGKDPFAGLPELGKVNADPAALQIFDPAILAMPPEQKIAAARQVEAIGRKDARVKRTFGGTFQTYEHALTLANSKGFSGTFRRTDASCGVAFQCGEGDSLFQDGWYEGSTSLASLPAPEAIAAKAVARVTRLVGARKVATQNAPVVFEPTMTSQLLLGLLAQCVAGASVARRQSFLVGKLGERIGNDLVNVVDDALLAGGRGSQPFDGEGVPSRTTPVVEKGVLRSFLLDTYYARKLKLASTGNAGGPTNLHWLAGSHSPEAIVKSVDRGLLLTGTLGLGTVPTTGDISLGAFGLWIEKGEIVHPVAEITISGNLGELLKNVQMVGTDLDRRRTVSGPTVKVAEMTIGGTAAKS